jgi:rhodanese-related sulfurtransferase
MKNSRALTLGKSLVLPILGLAGVFLGGCGDTVSDRDIQFVSLAETRALLQDKPGTAKAVDVRPRAEYAAGHLPGAINLELADVSETKDSIDPALAAYKFLVVYGADPGSGSARAMAKRFLRAGHKDPKCFVGGYSEWIGAGLKTETGAGAPTPR